MAFEKEEIILILFTDDILLLFKILKKLSKLCELIKSNKVASYNINTQKSVVFLYTSSEQSKMEIKTILFIQHQKNNILRNKFDFKKSETCTLKKYITSLEGIKRHPVFMNWKT